MSLHPLNGLPYGTMKRALAPSFAHAILLSQPEGEPSWHLVDLYGPLQGSCVDDAEVADWPIVYTPVDDDEWEFETSPVFPPFTAENDRYPLKTDNNYHFRQSDREIDLLARTQPHGRVVPNENGRRAKCSGPKFCGVCRREAEIVAATQSVGSDEQPNL